MNKKLLWLLTLLFLAQAPFAEAQQAQLAFFFVLPAAKMQAFIE